MIYLFDQVYPKHSQLASVTSRSNRVLSTKFTQANSARQPCYFFVTTLTVHESIVTQTTSNFDPVAPLVTVVAVSLVYPDQYTLTLLPLFVSLSPSLFLWSTKSLPKSLHADLVTSKPLRLQFLTLFLTTLIHNNFGISLICLPLVNKDCFFNKSLVSLISLVDVEFLITLSLDDLLKIVFATSSSPLQSSPDESR